MATSLRRRHVSSISSVVLVALAITKNLNDPPLARAHQTRDTRPQPAPLSSLSPKRAANFRPEPGPGLAPGPSHLEHRGLPLAAGPLVSGHEEASCENVASPK